MIRVSTTDTFRAVSSKVIDQLFDGGNFGESLDVSRLKDKEVLNLVLKRLGKELSAERFTQLLNFIKRPKEISSETKMLLYLLNSFFSFYETQIETDRRIKNFIAVANRYLVNKELRYDEVRIKIEVLSQLSERPIDLDRLSSGEKQIVSMLCRLYFSENETFAMIIDEPELSLSIEWQQMLLPDLLRSGKCKFLLAATHSPFIFENELQKITSTMLTSVSLPNS